MKCVWEHNGDDTLLYSVDYVGAFTRGENLDAAIRKMQEEVDSYLNWKNEPALGSFTMEIVWRIWLSKEAIMNYGLCEK